MSNKDLDYTEEKWKCPKCGANALFLRVIEHYPFPAELLNMSPSSLMSWVAGQVVVQYDIMVDCGSCGVEFIYEQGV